MRCASRPRRGDAEHGRSGRRCRAGRGLGIATKAKRRSPAALRLNLGAGEQPLDGYQNIDRKTGGECYPLACGDGEATEIRASHVLEHFSHRDVPAVLADWVRALKPGGLLKVAVPDFQFCAEQYLAGAQLPIEGYVMGGHVDADDHHGALFDFGTLTRLMAQVGLLGLSTWTSEADDCASLPVSLNLQGWKPPAQWPRTIAVMSVPRLSFTDNATCAERALRPLGIPVRHVQGAFWGQCLTRGIEAAIADGAEYILTVDYDSLYSRWDVECLLSAMVRHEDVDAVAALQAHRKDARALFTVDGDTNIPRETFGAELMPAASAHFGLTLFRALAFADLPRPWLYGKPDAEGGWGDGHEDDDVAFWRGWKAAGLKLCIANRVAIGHAELVARWPDQNLGVIYQSPHDFFENGKPEGVWK